MDLQTPIGQGSRIYKLYARRLEKLGIFKVEDFLYHIPFRYNDYSLISKISQVQPGETVTVKGKVIDIKNIFTRGFKRIQKALLEDDTGTIEAIWFNQPFILNIIKKNDLVSFSGKVKKNLSKNILESPEYEVFIQGTDTIHTGRLVPVYPETRGISSKWLRKQVYSILKENDSDLIEFLPERILENEKLLSIKKALYDTHFPKNLKDADEGKKRLAFDELLLTQLNGLLKRQQWQKLKSGRQFVIEKFKEEVEKYILSLPFELTNSQKKAVAEIIKDLSLKEPMNRLLEGDVGSGKTVVATVAIYLAYLNGLQTVLMAPTEILANQHYVTVDNLLRPFGVKVELITSSTKRIHNSDVVIGTHAVLYRKINRKNLGLVIVDEQQRFGVEQRAIIRGKGENPHFLTMTATPIPRTVALTMYGDLDLSYLSEMPKGRKFVKTWLVSEEKRNNAYKWIEKQIKENNDQAFIICPFIKESESMVTVKAAVKEFEKLKKEIFPKLRVCLLHGKMKSKEKESVLNKFREGKFDILVATPVVEVGIDIPNATIMLVDGAERFGLSQLHQLRGRVGRGEKQAYCLLFANEQGRNTYERLKIMEHTFIGAQLAEFDLKLRGPGDIYGKLQHGIPELKVASFSDFNLIRKTKEIAQSLLIDLDSYPKLKGKLKSAVFQTISPD